MTGRSGQCLTRAAAFSCRSNLTTLLVCSQKEQEIFSTPEKHQALGVLK